MSAVLQLTLAEILTIPSDIAVMWMVKLTSLGSSSDLQPRAAAAMMC